MAPWLSPHILPRVPPPEVPTKSSQSTNVNVIEAWGEGFNFGGLIILMLIVICNIRRRVLLHKLILLEQFLALWHATIIFNKDPVYGWYLSSTVVPLYVSYFMHNFIAWMKIRPFLSRRATWIYLGSLFIVQPYWIIALWTNYENFNGLGDNHYAQVRPWEALAREPWWIFTTFYLIWVLKKGYSCGFWELIGASPRFGVLSFCMILSVMLAVVDAVVVVINLNNSNGINPFWRMSLVFKCAADTIFLDDFKKLLDSLVANGLNKAVGRQQYSAYSGAEPSKMRVPESQGGSQINRYASTMESGHSGFAFHSMSTRDGFKYGPSVDIRSTVDVPSRAHIQHESCESRLFQGRSRQSSGSSDLHIMRETSITMEALTPSELKSYSATSLSNK